MGRAAAAQESFRQVKDNYGGVGIIDMPSARMAPDGELSFGASFQQNTQHYNLGLQILPWLEGSFRYSGLQHYDAAYPTYYDRSFAFKARLWNEGAFLPALAIGVNDLVGTGVYGGEYIVASKAAGPVDASIGIGWGRLGTAGSFANPLGRISSSFNQRVSKATGVGQFQFSEYFHGPAAIFGGLVWHTPIDRLDLMAEYSSDAYRGETASGGSRPHSQINYGASYQVTDGIQIGLSWIYGRSINGSISFQLDPTGPAYRQKITPAPVPPVIRTAEEQKQALNTVVRRRNGNVPRGADAQKNEFVDALWRQPGVTDVSVRGRELVVTVASGDPRQRCAMVTAIARAYAPDMGGVTTRTDGGPATRCAAGAAPAALVQQVRQAAMTGLPDAGRANAALVTIDAAAAIPSDIPQASQRIRAEASRQNIKIESLTLTGGQATVYYANTSYFAEADGLNRLTRILMANAPSDIEQFRLVSIRTGQPQAEFLVFRAQQERAITQDGKLDLAAVTDTLKAPPLQNPSLRASQRGVFPRFSWDITPQLRQEIFDPSEPFGIQLVAAASALLELKPGLSLNGEVEASLFDTFNKNRVSDSVLPHVRTDFLEYLKHGRNGIGNLDADYRFRLAPNIFAVAKVGYLESMFAGAGGEVLWRPEGQRWALGVDAYEVWQRNFDRLFGLQPYHVLTGHVSLYYASPWHQLNFALRAGQYLAGDRGLTFEVTRRFSSGVEIGVFVTKTNVSARDFGEGSFDKGIIFRMPLGWALPIDTQSEFRLDLRPVQRDGGQRMLGDTTLYDETLRTSQSELAGAAASQDDMR